jgi:hypothetical protein
MDVEDFGQQKKVSFVWELGKKMKENQFDPEEDNWFDHEEDKQCNPEEDNQFDPQEGI